MADANDWCDGGSQKGAYRFLEPQNGGFTPKLSAPTILVEQRIKRRPKLASAALNGNRWISSIIVCIVFCDSFPLRSNFCHTSDTQPGDTSREKSNRYSLRFSVNSLIAL